MARKIEITVKYDKRKLDKVLKQKGKNRTWLSRELGYDDSYISERESRYDSKLQKAIFAAVCSILDVQAEELLYEEPELDIHEQSTLAASDILKAIKEVRDICNLTYKMTENENSELAAIKKSLKKAEDDNEAAWNKLNSINTEIVRTKAKVDNLKLDMNDSLQEMSGKLAVLRPDESENVRKAKLLLNEMMNHGKTEENEIYNEAEKQGINRKHIDRAKTEMGIIVTAKGYGKNQRKTWQRRKGEGEQ